MDTQKIAIVSGAFGYVGLEISKQLAQDGMSVAMLYHNDDSYLVGQKLSELSGEGHRAYACDLGDQKSLQTVLNTIESDMGCFSVCVHVAGKKPQRKTLTASSEEDLRSQFEGNVMTSFNFLSLCARKLQERKDGVIVGITTVGVIAPEATRSLGTYIPAKYAVQGMLAMLKEEMKQFSIRVYSVAPGFMHGGMNSDIPKAFADMIKEKNDSKRLTSATDVAERVAYLCSERAKDEKELTFVVAEEVR